MIKSTIEQRAWSNTVVGGISFLVTMAQTLALVPILLEYWGSENYGLWLTLMAGFSLLQTLDLGHQNYVGNQLNVQYHLDKDAFQCSLASSLYVAYLLGFIELVVCLILVAGNNLYVVLSVPQTVIVEHQLGLGLLLLVLMWFTFGSVGGIIVRILIPTGRLYQSQWLGISMRLAQFLSIAVVAAMGGSILAVCFWYAVSQSIISLMVLWYIRKTLPEFFPWWRNGRLKDGFLALRKSIVLTLNSIGTQLANNGLLILIAAVFSAAVIPSFTTLRTLTNTASAVTTILITALLPDMIRFHATRDSKKLLSIFSVNWFIGGLLVNLGLVGVLPVIQPLYQIWTKGKLDFNVTLFFLLAVAISLVNFGSGLKQYLEGINDLRAQTMMTIGRLGSLFGIGYLLSGSLGLVSIGVGAVAAELIASVFLPVLFVNGRLSDLSAKLPLRQLGYAVVPPLSLLFLGCAAAYWGIPLFWVTIVMLPTLAGLYYAVWKELGNDLRQRITVQLRTKILRVAS